MCGIAGLMMRSGAAADGSRLKAMAEALYHRGPDSTDVWSQDAVGLVSDRLAIMDVEGGNQPLFGPNGSVLVANGEIYNNPDLRAALAHHSFRTGSDCEPAVHLYERDGPGYAASLRGMYAIAIWDPRLGQLVLSRDPFGIKPLYYVETNAGFWFASEPQALIAAKLAAPNLIDTRRNELLQLKYTIGRQTIFEDVKRVLPGETLIIKDGQIAERLRLNALSPAPGRTRPDKALSAFETVMMDSVEQHLHTDVPYGLFLSGGVDSSILLLLMQRLSRTPIRAITVGYSGGPKMDESRSAKAFADRHGADCHRVQMGEDDFFRFAPQIAAAIDDPTCDAAVLPTWMLGKAARSDGLKVTLCGEGADELFGGYRRYRPTLLQRLRGPRPRKGVFDKVEGAPPFESWRAGIDAAEHKIHRQWRGEVTRMQALDIAEWLPNDLLIKLDRCLMAHSIEGRTPYLDSEVAKFAASLPDGLKIRGDIGKITLRRWLAKADPQYPAMAKKRGFNTPVGRWIAVRAPQVGPLVAAQPGIKALFDAPLVEAVINDADRRDQPAWSLLYYALWHSVRVLGVNSEGDIAAVLAEAAR